MYELECPNCQHINQVVSENPVVEWTCENCESEPLTSLPTDGEGNLL
jgi:ribosomal protein S27E